MNERNRTAGSVTSTSERVVDRTGVGKVLDTRSKLDTALLESLINVDVCSLLPPLSNLVSFILIAFREKSQLGLPSRQIADSSPLAIRPKPHHVSPACDVPVKEMVVKNCRIAMFAALAAGVPFGRTRGGGAAAGRLKRNDRLEVALAGARRRQSWIAVSQQDLDHFKRPQGA